MVKSNARSVETYLGQLPADRRVVMAEVRKAILRRLPPGYQEVMNWGMIAYQVPLERYPKTYKGQPLLVAALAAQKKNNSLYLTSVYQKQEAGVTVARCLCEIGKEAGDGEVLPSL